MSPIELQPTWRTSSSEHAASPGPATDGRRVHAVRSASSGMRLSIRWKLGILLGAVAGLAVVALGSLQALSAFQDRRAEVVSENLEIARLAAHQVDGLTTQTTQLLWMLAADPELVADVMAQDAGRVNARLEALAPYALDLSLLGVVDPAGRLWATSLKDKSSIGTDASARRHVRVALDYGIAAPDVSRLGPATGLPIVGFGVPIRDPSGRILGVLTGALSLEHLSHLLSGIRVGSGGHVSLSDVDGTRLTHPDPTRILTRVNAANHAVAGAPRGEPTSVETLDEDGTPIFAAAVQIGSLGWIVQAQVPVDEAYAPVWAQLRRAGTTALIAFLLATVVGMVAARRLAAPIVQLRAVTRRIAIGEFEADIPDIRSGDETEELARDFDVMAANVRELIKRLKARAEEQARLYARAEQARGETRAILDATGEAIVLVSPERRFVTANRRFGDLFGILPENVLDRTIEELRAEFERIFVDPLALQARMFEAAGDAAAKFTEIVAQRWPAPRELQLFSSPVHGTDGRHLGRLFVFRDVTRERAVDRMKTEFVSMVSHEFRTPLTSIKGYVDLLLDGDAGPIDQVQREFLEVVEANTNRLVTLVSDLLDVARIEAGKGELRRVPLDLGRLVEGAARSLRPQIEARGQQLTLDLTADLPAVLGDADRMTQVLVNLLSNAHKYTPPGGEITVSLRHQDDDASVRLDVSDTGIGMSADEQAQLFTKFFRAHNRVTQESAGSGLGLVITRSLVEAHGGEIAVTSAVGEGSTFSVILPATAAAVEPELPSDLPRPGGRVLVVEDHDEIAALIRRYLERAGYEVLTAFNAAQAFTVARAEQPDVITLDILLPDVDGLTVLEWLKADPTTAAIPVVMLSMLPHEGDPHALGAVDYLTKPVQESVLLERVGRLLAGVRPRRVLVADDDEDTRSLLARQLSRAGHRVIVAADGAEAVALTREEAPDLLLMDVRMPGVDGIEALRVLRTQEQTKHVPVVMMTASPEVLQEHQRTVESLGGTTLVTTPITAEELAQAISRGFDSGVSR